jgi:hypothetical protein
MNAELFKWSMRHPDLSGLQTFQMEYATSRFIGTSNQLTNQPINQLTNQPINQSTNQPINQSTSLPVNQSTNQPNTKFVQYFLISCIAF